MLPFIIIHFLYLLSYKGCYLCVANVDYKNNDQVHIVLVNFDEEYVNKSLLLLKFFWKENIYPL